MLPTEVKPVLCLQKGILSPSCLPAFGKVYLCSLYRLIFRYERDFSFVSERDSHFFDKTILPHFSLHVNHVKLFHLVVLDLRSVRDPELPPGGVRPAQMRSSAASFAKISPDMILGYGVGNRCILFDMKQLSY